jgi:putative ABC transport system permease protein
MLAALLRPSLRAIRRNALRSALTMLGIVIGVSAVIAMVTMGAGVTAQVGSNLSKLGTRLLLVRPGQSQPGSGGARSDAASFTIADVQAIEREVPGIAAVAPMNSRSVQAIAGSRNRLTSVVGSSGAYLGARSWELSSGRSFRDGEERAGADLCVLGATVRKDLFGAVDPVGQRIRLGRLSCEVIGALEGKGASGFGSDQDDFVLVPLRWYQREVAGDAEVKSIYVSAREGEPTARLSADLEQLLRQRRRVQRNTNDFSIRDMTEIETAAVATTRALTEFLGALAAVSMLVGGIGIMNIMLVSVTERTQEIGIRLAVGVLERDVQRQFLMEAAVLASTGGIIGIVLGLAAGAVGVRALDVPFVLQPGIILLAFAVSAAVGLAFGYYPARRAARLDPIEALRHE